MKKLFLSLPRSKKAILIPFFIALFVSGAYAQDFIREFGKYSNEDFSLTQCPFEPEAEAVIIYDIGKTGFYSSQTGYDIIFERKFKIKIFNKAGLKHTEFVIPLYTGYRGSDQIISIKANAYNFENGSVRVTEMNPKEVYSKRVNDKLVLKTFAVPDIREGTVFDVLYKTSSPYYFTFNDWEFQQEIPVLYSEYTAVMMPIVEYVYNLQGANKFDEYKTYPIRKANTNPFEESKDDMAYFFVMKNIPSLKTDEFMTSDEDYRIRLNFQLSAYASGGGAVVKVLSTWEELIKEFNTREEFGKYIKSAEGKAKDILPQITLPPTELEKAKALRNYMISKFSFDGTLTPLAKKSTKEFINSAKGNSAEINLFYTGLLKAAGLNANPVLISTRDNGKINQSYPFLEAFNYVMVLLTAEGKNYLLDATQSIYSFEEIPPVCLNETGLLITKDGPVNWITYKSQVNSEARWRTEVSLSEDKSSFLHKYSLELTGYDAASYRNKYLSNYEDLYKSLVNQHYEGSDSIKQLNLHLPELPFIITFSQAIPIEKVENKIIIDPFCGKAITENPLKQKTRNFPIDFNYRFTRSFETTFDIPEGYTVASKPDNLIVNNQAVKILYTIDDSIQGKLKVTAQYEFKKDVYPAETYQNLKGYYNMIVDKLNEKIVLETKAL